MVLLIDIFSINRSQGYENSSLDIIVIELCSTRGFPIEEASEHCSQSSKCYFWCYSGIISVLLWCCSGYIVVHLPFLAFYFCSA
jgi:hypothetical protein